MLCHDRVGGNQAPFNVWNRVNGVGLAHTEEAGPQAAHLLALRVVVGLRLDLQPGVVAAQREGLSQHLITAQSHSYQ